MSELIKRYEEYYQEMASSKDPAKMRVFGAAEHKMFKKIAMAMPRMAEEWLEQLEPMHWINYLTRVEADEIVARLEGADGTMGPHWGFDTFKKAVEGFSGHLCEEPFYNFCALWATANMLYSDHSVTWGKHISREDEPFFYYQTAVDKLKDKDRPHFVREYFHLTD